jgi:hypothetical protein
VPSFLAMLFCAFCHLTGREPRLAGYWPKSYLIVLLRLGVKLH